MLEWGDNLFHDQRRRCVVSVDILAMSEAEIRARGVVWVVGELERLDGWLGLGRSRRQLASAVRHHRFGSLLKFWIIDW